MEYLVVDPRYEYMGLEADIVFKSRNRLEAAKVAMEFGEGFCVIDYNPETESEDLIYEVGQEEFLFAR